MQYDALVVSADDGAEREPRAGEPTFFFNYVRVAYERFLAEDDAKVEELRATVAAAFGEQHEVLLAGNAAVRAENDRLKAELAALRAQSVRACVRALRATASYAHASCRLARPGSPVSPPSSPSLCATPP